MKIFHKFECYYISHYRKRGMESMCIALLLFLNCSFIDKKGDSRNYAVKNSSQWEIPLTLSLSLFDMFDTN